MLETGKSVQMADLQKGDRVKTGRHVTSTLLLFLNKNIKNI